VDDGAVEPLVGHDDVAATREHEDRLAGRVGLTDGGDEVVLVRGLDEPARRPAEPQGGQRGERRQEPAGAAVPSPTGQLTPVPPMPQ
jgi:hypothetical protein